MCASRLFEMRLLDCLALAGIHQTVSRMILILFLQDRVDKSLTLK